jgi:chromosome segregation ATPase
MRILYPLLLALFAIFVSAQEEAQAEEVQAEKAPVTIDCGKDCADFVAAILDAEKASSSELLAKCRAATDEIKQEHEKTIAELQDEIKTLESNTKKSSELEKELRAQQKDLEAKWAKEAEAHRVLLVKAQDLAKKSQQQVVEATMEIKELMESLGSQRVNFKGIWDDLMAMWKKLVVAVKKDSNAPAPKEQELKPDL